MCNTTCITYGATVLSSAEIAGKRVLEAGARDHNGSLRAIIEHHGPREYIGTDLEEGAGTDVLCDVTELVRVFGEESFDLVVATEIVEHVVGWREAISNLKRVCRAGGVLLLSTRSRGYRFHPCPEDFWRFELDDMREILGDMVVEDLRPDRPLWPGVLLKARKPERFVEKNLAGVALYSIADGARVLDVDPRRCRRLFRRNRRYELMKAAAKRALGAPGGAS
jgi:SAM-dependent methyltransferase